VPSSLNILTLCTGNVARSVMLAFMLQTIGEANGVQWQLRSAGTHVIEGSAISPRTLRALQSLDELGEHHYGAHRSHQVDEDDVAWADIVLASEANHVNYVRRHFPLHAHKAVSLHQFVLDAALDESFEDTRDEVSSREPDPACDVRDPAGGDDATYIACAQELWELAQAFAVLLEDD
jgi:protein-tyrosine phosphatase